MDSAGKPWEASGIHLNLSSLQREGYATQIVIIIMIMFHRMHLQVISIQTLSYDIISSLGERKKEDVSIIFHRMCLNKFR